MKIKIIIKTPKGQATGTEKKLRPFIIGKKANHQIFTTPEDNQILWELETDIRHALKIQRNVTAYDSMIKGMFSHKLMKKLSDKQLSPEDKKQLEEMLINQTSVEIIKESDAMELVEGTKTFWEKLKEKFKKQEN